jgi:hypothetical protein
VKNLRTPRSLEKFHYSEQVLMNNNLTIDETKESLNFLQLSRMHIDTHQEASLSESACPDLKLMQVNAPLSVTRNLQNRWPLSKQNNYEKQVKTWA